MLYLGLVSVLLNGVGWRGCLCSIGLGFSAYCGLGVGGMI